MKLQVFLFHHFRLNFDLDFGFWFRGKESNVLNCNWMIDQRWLAAYDHSINLPIAWHFWQIDWNWILMSVAFLLITCVRLVIYTTTCDYNLCFVSNATQIRYCLVSKLCINCVFTLINFALAHINIRWQSQRPNKKKTQKQPANHNKCVQVQACVICVAWFIAFSHFINNNR